MSLEDQMVEARRRVRETFTVFEHREGSKLVDNKEIPTIVRSLGINPTPHQLQLLQNQLSEATADEGSFIPLEVFEVVVGRYLVEDKAAMMRDDYHTILRALKSLDAEGRGYIEVEELKNLLSSRGDAFSAEEANSLAAFAADPQGRVHLEDYAARLSQDGRKL